MYIEYDMDTDLLEITNYDMSVVLTRDKVEELYANLTAFLGKEVLTEVPTQA